MSESTKSEKKPDTAKNNQKTGQVNRAKSNSEVRFRLSIKFSLAIILLLIVIMTVGGWMLIGMQERALIAEKERSADKLIEFVAAMSAYNIERFTYFIIHETAEMLQKSEGLEADVLSVIVRGNPEGGAAQGKKLHLNGREPSEIPVPEKYWLRKTEPCVYEGGGERKVLGSVEMIFSLELVYRTVANTRLAFVFTMLILIAFIAGALIWFLMRIVVNPLRILTTSAEEIARGNFDVEIKLDTRDEIGFLAQAIGNMSRELKRSIDEIAAQKEEIQGYSKNLQTMVDQRTAELHSANEELTTISQQFMAEIDMARRVQKSMFPDEESLKMIAELSIAARYVPIGTIGGSFYDMARIGRSTYSFLVADLSVHGVFAALVNTLAKTLFRASGHHGITPAETCRRVNDELHTLVADLGHYLTAYYGVLELDTGLFHYASAGHRAAFLWRAQSETVERLHASGVYIGVREEGKYESQTIQLAPGDRVLLFTNGLIDVLNESDEPYGEARLSEYVQTHSDLHPDDFVAGLVNTVSAYGGGAQPEDDQSVLYFEFLRQRTE